MQAFWPCCPERISSVLFSATAIAADEGAAVPRERKTFLVL
jgi:hypothetical protein